ncbi:MAG: 7-cyano-7-deazaguanine synthase QueC [Firmicutes bacterium]|nr:7-cyano-7-deazaguanine synthase QueC [Bacillota bacterium]
MTKKNAVVLFSGGQDSTTCLYLAKKEYQQVFAIGFDYGQRHKKEIECATAIAKKAGVAYEVLPVPIVSMLAPNALTRADMVVDKYSEQSNRTSTPPNTLVEGRNLFFLSFAAVYAKTRGIKDIFIGVSQTDYSGYPDCRLDFVQSLQRSLRLAMEYDFEIHTPLMHLDKAQTWELAHKLGVLDIIQKDTLTCYNGVQGSGCGQCPACVLRQRGYEQFVKNHS